jgi:uncharacterized membrane protein
VTSLQIICLIIFAISVVYVVTKTDFKRIIEERKWQHIIFGSAVAILVLWSFRVSIYDGLVIHFLWLTTLTLVLGFRWAILVATTILLISTIIGNEHWSMIGVNGLIGVFLPIVITYGIFAFSFHRVSRHLFVYIFICAFFPGAISIGAKMLAMSAYYYFDGAYTWDILQYNYTNLTILMVFPEAFFNGFSITCLIIYRPDLVHTYHDKFYLDGK